MILTAEQHSHYSIVNGRGELIGGITAYDTVTRFARCFIRTPQGHPTMTADGKEILWILVHLADSFALDPDGNKVN